MGSDRSVGKVLIDRYWPTSGGEEITFTGPKEEVEKVLQDYIDLYAAPNPREGKVIRRHLMSNGVLIATFKYWRC